MTSALMDSQRLAVVRSLIKSFQKPSRSHLRGCEDFHPLKKTFSGSKFIIICTESSSSHYTEAPTGTVGPALSTRVYSSIKSFIDVRCGKHSPDSISSVGIAFLKNNKKHFAVCEQSESIARGFHLSKTHNSTLTEIRRLTLQPLLFRMLGKDVWSQFAHRYFVPFNSCPATTVTWAGYYAPDLLTPDYIVALYRHLWGYRTLTWTVLRDLLTDIWWTDEGFK
ncbi:hypothetical protein IW262DRAFT_265269 [Armillaria fumosa]|nr:hypothetical protein IW262DRAFT_265269 [Armillaria fumosa]